MREVKEREKVKGEERYRRGMDGESFSALSGWNNWHFMWKDPGSLGSLFIPITLLFTPLSMLSISLPHNRLEFEQISVEHSQHPVTQEPKVFVTDGNRDVYTLMFNKPTKIL